MFYISTDELYCLHVVERHAVDNGEYIPDILKSVFSRIALNSIRKRAEHSTAWEGFNLRNRACTIAYKNLQLCNPRWNLIDSETEKKHKALGRKTNRIS